MHMCNMVHMLRTSHMLHASHMLHTRNTSHTRNTLHTLHTARMLHTLRMLHTRNMSARMPHLPRYATIITRATRTVASSARTHRMMCAWNDHANGTHGTGDGMGVKGTPQERRDAQSESARDVLGLRGAIGDGHGTVAFAYCSRHPHVNVCDARNTHADPMRIDDRRRDVLRWRDLIGGTSDVHVVDPYDGTRDAPTIAAARAVRATLTGAFDVRAQRERERINGRHERAQRDDGHIAHACPSERRDVTRKCRCDAHRSGYSPDHERAADGTEPTRADCTRTHATTTAQRACGATHTQRDDRNTRYRATVALARARSFYAPLRGLRTNAHAG